MTFEELKTEILSRAKVLELCPAYHAALIASNENELIAAAAELIVWSYQSNVIDDTLINEFSNEALNEAGIYKNGESITNPSIDIYYLKSGTATLTLNGNNKSIVRVMGDVSLTVNMSGNSYLDIKGYDTCNLTINLSNNSSALIEATQNININIVADDSTISQITSSDKTSIVYTGNDNSHVIVRTFNNSELEYSLNDSATGNFQSFNNSTITENSPL